MILLTGKVGSCQHREFNFYKKTCTKQVFLFTTENSEIRRRNQRFLRRIFVLNAHFLALLIPCIYIESVLYLEQTNFFTLKNFFMKKILLPLVVFLACSSVSRAQVTFDSLRVFLGGSYDPSIGLMRDDLRSAGFIPLSQPYSSSPYYKMAIGEPDNEQVTSTVLSTTGPEAIVDWVYLEVLNPLLFTDVVATKRALVRRDGYIVDPSGLSYIIFQSLTPGSYILRISHRNHLPVETLVPVNCLTGNGTFDFTTGLLFNHTASPGYYHTPTKIVDGVQVLWPGDANINRVVKYNGTYNDKESIAYTVGSANLLGYVTGYRAEDVNLDGIVKYNGTLSSGSDRVYILNTLMSCPANTQQSPNFILYPHTHN